MSDKDRVTSLDEVTRVLKMAFETKAEVYCQFEDLQVSLEIRGVSGSRIVFGIAKPPGTTAAPLIASAFGNRLATGKIVEVVLSLVDGQYAVRDVVHDTSLATFTMSASTSMMRLQRRRDFRVPARGHGVKFEMREIAPSLDALKKLAPAGKAPKVIEALELLDLSAGGMRLVWSPTCGAVPAIGSVVRGRLALPDGKSAEDIVATFVKDHGPMPLTDTKPGFALSFQFQGLDQESARAILFACLFIHRDRYGGAADA